jgi:hypothetical protein
LAPAVTLGRRRRRPRRGEPADRFVLLAVVGHLHQLDAVAVRILDPRLPVAVDGQLLRPEQGDSLSLDLRDDGVDVVDGQAEMVEPDGVRRRCPIAHRVGEQFDVLLVGNPEIDDPQPAILLQSEHLGETELVDVEVERPVDVLDADRHVPDRRYALHAGPCLPNAVRPAITGVRTA